MNMQDTVTIAEFADVLIEAVYDYRLDMPSNGPEAIKVNKVELLIKKIRSRKEHDSNKRSYSWELSRTIRLLDIPSWLWEILTSYAALQSLSPPAQSAGGDRDEPGEVPNDFAPIKSEAESQI
jgi:hypothetical protein